MLNESKLFLVRIATPVLLAVFPVIFLYSNNLNQIEAPVTYRSLTIILLVSLILSVVVALLFRNSYAVFIMSIALLFFFTYGHIYAAVKNLEIFGFMVGRHRYLAPVWLLLAIVVIWLTIRWIKDLDRLMYLIFAIAIGLVLVSATNIIWFQLRTSQSQTMNNNPEDLIEPSYQISSEKLPDIYYIIMDGYGRQDTIQEAFEYDNSEFLQTLEGMGFFIAECSQSNYAQTELSLASSLNMAYLDELGDTFLPNEEDRSPLWNLIKHSTTRNILNELGYSIVAFETGFYWTHLDDADLFLQPSTTTLDKWSFQGGLNGFEVMLFKTTGGLLIADGVMTLPSMFAVDIDSPIMQHRERVLFTIDELASLSEYPGPKFVFAHIVSPHSPFVFDMQGNPVLDNTVNEDDAPPAMIKSAYRDQVIFLNTQLEAILQSLITESDIPPVIILQADHGPGKDVSGDYVRHRMSILNAYYFPPGLDRKELHIDISPVNSFRVVFNSLLDTDLPLLEDNAYYSGYQSPYAYTLIENRCSVGTP